LELEELPLKTPLSEEQIKEKENGIASEA